MAKNPKDRSKKSGDMSGTSARATAGGPAHPDKSAKGREDAAFKKLSTTQDLAAQMPSNENKAKEYGKEAANPPEGKCIKPGDTSVTGSTLTETVSSKKVGEGKPPLGINLTNSPLDMVRVDSGGRPLTTNLGVPVSDNQSSLKAGVARPGAP